MNSKKKKIKKIKKIDKSQLKKIQGGTHCYELLNERSRGNAKPPEGVLNVINC